MASVDKRTTGTGARYDVRYRGADRAAHKRSFRRKVDAERFAATVTADMLRGEWVDPHRGRATLADYAPRWLADRQLRPRTRELYAGLLRLHVLPAIGALSLADIDTAAVRRWHAAMVRSAADGSPTPAKAYRLLRTIMATAVEDGLVRVNPCVLKGAGVERSPERPTATLSDVHALADAVPDRWRAMVLVATFCGLRLGELAGLQRRHVDLLHGTVTVAQQLHEVGGRPVLAEPKSAAGRRTVAIPAPVVEALEGHLARYAEPGPDGFVFVGDKGGKLRRGNWSVTWAKARRAAGVEGLHFHDLRHTGNTLAAATGASTKELMARMGHASPRAALIYQHASADRDRAIADALGALIDAAPAPSGAIVCAMDVP